MSSLGEAPGRSCLKPAYMDRSYTSMHWFTEEPWTRRDQPLPYQHPNEDKHLYQIAGYSECCVPAQGKQTAHEQTKLWAREVQNAWKAAQNLTVSKSSTDSAFNVNTITGLLPLFLERQLREIVNVSWDRMFEDARSRRSSAQGGDFEKYDSRFNQNGRLPSVRDMDVREYFRLRYMSGEYPGHVSASNDDQYYEIDIWNTLYKADRLPEREDAPKSFMLSFLNQKDLCNPNLLRCLILNRITNHPRNFARADWEGCHLGFASKICQGERCDNWFMGFPTEEERGIPSSANRSECYDDYPVVFKDPTRNDTVSGLFDRLRKAGRIFSWGEGMAVLAVQALTLRFVVALAKQIEEEVESRRLAGQDLNGQPLSKLLPVWQAHTWQKIPPEMLQFDVGETDLVACHQFFPPAASIEPWDQEFTNILQERLDKAEQYVFNLWHDPFFFQDRILSQYHQHYGHISEYDIHGNGHALPHITNSDIDAKKALVNDLIRRVVRWAAFNLEMWKCLAGKLAALKQVAAKSRVSLDKWNPSLSRKGPIQDAWIDLGFHARWFAERHVIHAADHGGLLASESLRSYFERISSWETMKTPTPGDEWALPRQFYTKIGMAVKSINCETLDVKDNEHIGSSEDDLAMSALIMHVGLKDEHTIGCVGLHKLIQAMRSNRQQKHSDLRVQPMVSDDYDNVFWTGLLSLRMEAIRPFGDAIAKSTVRVSKQSAGDIGRLFKEYDRFPFEDHVDQNTLRMVHWSLGVTYAPYPASSPSRPSGLVQDWLQDFWLQIIRWLRPENNESGTLPGPSSQGGGGSMDAEDDQAEETKSVAKHDEESRANLDSCMTGITKVLREFVDSRQGLGDADFDRNSTTPAIIETLESFARVGLRKFLKGYNFDGLEGSQLETAMDVACRTIWGLLLQQGIAPNEALKDGNHQNSHAAPLLYCLKAFYLLLKERHPLQERWEKEKANQDGRPKLIRRPRAQGSSRVRKKRTKSQRDGEKNRMLRAQPKELLKYLDAQKRNEYRPDPDIFGIKRICGDITTMPPEGHMEMEPTEEYRPPPGYSRRTRVWGAEINRSLNKVTLDLCRDIQEIEQELQGEGRQGELKSKDWETADIILGDSPGEVNYKTFMAFCYRLGFNIANRNGSRVAISWTEKCRFPRPEKPTLVIHIRHPGGVTRRLDEDIIGSCKRSFRDDFGLDLEELEKLYKRR